MQKRVSRKCLIIACSLIAVSAAWAAVEWLVLPDAVTVQVSLSKMPGNMMPKLMAIAIPFTLSVVFAVVYMLQGGQTKHLLLSLLGALLPALTLALNIA